MERPLSVLGSQLRDRETLPPSPHPSPLSIKPSQARAGLHTLRQTLSLSQVGKGRGVLRAGRQLGVEWGRQDGVLGAGDLRREAAIRAGRRQRDHHEGQCLHLHQQQQHQG
ncbi:hypothetical protein chiPu_0027119, partial [Chiloscyllium punctatum]|nr:hypothetical protein [Chiloscyllium punctatum]